MTELPQLPKRKVLYRRLRASSNLMVQKRASSQQSRQAPNLTKKKRAPPTPQSAKKTSCLTRLARERTELLTVSSSSSEDGRELTLQKKAWSSPDLQKAKSCLPPLPSFQEREDEYSTSCSHASGLERLSALFHRRQCLAHPFIFSGDDALENFQSQGKSLSCFLDSSTDALENLESQGVSPSSV